MRCDCGHELSVERPTTTAIRTPMVLIKSTGEDQVLAVVCPRCKQDALIGFFRPLTPDLVLDPITPPIR